jgi:hypothetical protein
MSPYTQNTVVLHGDGGSLDDFIFHFPCQIIEVGRIPGDSDQEVRIRFWCFVYWERTVIMMLNLIHIDKPYNVKQNPLPRISLLWQVWT